MKKHLRIGIMAGEASGDILGAGLIRGLKEQYPDAEFEGIGGPLMMAEGCRSLFPMETLSVFGLFEVVRHLPDILRVLNRLTRYFIDNPPDVFIGVDAPDSCLRVEKKLKAHGIPTVHYVSPSIWMWRPKRALKIERSADMVLCVLPFEPELYQPYGVQAEFVGHTLADQIPMEPDRYGARKQLGLAQDRLIIGILPGSRRGEVERLSPVFLEAAARLQQLHPAVEFLIPCASPRLKPLIEAELQKHLAVKARILDGQSREAMTASDFVLLASGTAALEAMLLKKPMVVSYRLAPLTYSVATRITLLPWVSLPNILARKFLVPELLQQDATPEKICAALVELMENAEGNDRLLESFRFYHKRLRRNSDQAAAAAVLKLVRQEI